MNHQRVTRKPRMFCQPSRRRYAAFALLLWSAIGAAQASESGLSMRSGDGAWLPAVMLDSSVEMRVRGLIAEVVLTQRYVNESAQWQEGRYLLPLPADAAVGRLRVHIGQRLIEGEVREKEAARQAYLQASRQGQTAAIVEQQRANLFRTGLTNIGPGETIEVEIGYWQSVSYRDQVFSLSLPMTLTPAHVPADALLADDEIPDALPSASASARLGLERSVSLSVDLQAGVPLLRVESPTHRIRVDSKGGSQRIELAELVELADRDFELRWYPLPSSVPQRAVFAEEVDGEQYALLMLLPPTQAVAALPREMILVVDTSGSMHGVAMEQAIAALDAALLQLRPGDYFNVVRFSDQSERLFPESMALNSVNLQNARRYVSQLSAGGGTNMAPALLAAFSGAPPPGAVRQVVLATDAAIGNEAELLAMVENLRGEARLFPVGIGSAPNGHFIRKAAELGRGSEVVIRNIGEVTERMRDLFARLDRPVLKDIQLQWPDATEIYPPRLPDLYAGEPLQIIARLPVLQGEIDIQGMAPGKPWLSKMKLQPSHVVHADGVGRLWGRARIEAIEDAMRAGLPEADGRAQIVETALRHGLTSRFTSLIAVERTPSRPLNADLAATDIPNADPANSIAMAQGSTDARFQLGLGITLALMAAALLRRRETPAVAGLA